MGRADAWKPLARTSKIARGEEVDSERRVIDLRDGQYSGATTTDGDCLPCRVP